MRKQIEIEIEVLEKNFPERIPDGLKNKEREKLISNSFIIESEDGKNIIHSGGYRIFLVMVKHFGGREKMRDTLLKKKSWEQYKEFLTIIKREDLFGVGKFKGDINSEIILE
jgi:hypothetical protein